MQRGLLAVAFTVSTAALAYEALPKKAPETKENPTTSAKVSLGKALYFDKRLSKDNTVSCNSCHNVNQGGVDNPEFPTSKGINGQFGGRNSPTVLNAAFLSVQFWDGRAATLEDQAKGPLVNPVEMGMKDHAEVVEKVKSIPGYAKLFKAAFSKDKEPINIDNLARAIAAFERTLVTPDAPLDRYLKGDKKALSPDAEKGMMTFQTKGCVACHQGPFFAGPQLPVGQGFYMRFPSFPGTEYDKKYGFSKDQGRFEVTKNEGDRHFFRVPSLRNVELTGPYFHNGAVKTLDEAVRVMAKTQLNQDLTDDEAKYLVAFLKSLTGKQPKVEEPKIVQ